MGLGSNLGDREKNLNQAIQFIEERIGTIIARSAFISTASWGYESENLFLNAAILCHTLLSPNEVLRQLQEIEIEMGRVHTKEEYEDRIIDLDILFDDDLIINSQKLTIPHPYIQQRLFVLIPLMEIASDFIHPQLNQSIEQLQHSIKE